MGSLGLAIVVSALACAAQQPLIFDTDIGNDVDDALALAMLHSFASRGEIQLKAVTITKDNPWAARLVSAIDRFYGHGQVPIGLVRNGQTKDEGYLRKALDAGHYRYDNHPQEAVAVLRRVLEAADDGSVLIVQVGFSTNLARLLDSPGGRDLAAKKVKRLVLMAGDFTGGGPEYNVKTDIPAAQRVASDWPGPIYWSGYEVGAAIKYPARSIERDFGPPGRNPVADAYRVYKPMPYDRETWDLTAALYAIRPHDGYFSVSPPGRVTVDARGMTVFRPEPGGSHFVLSANVAQRARVLEAFLWLCTQPPGGR